MKRIVSFIIVLTIFYLVFQFGVNILKTSHNINYTIEDDGRKYSINEIYSKRKNIDYYLLNIKVNDLDFIFDINNSFNKQKKIIKKIYAYEDSELTCLYLVYLNDKTSTEPLCNIKNALYSYNGIKDTYNLNDYINTLPNYDKTLEKSSLITRDYYDIKIYYENILEKESLVVYNYKNLLNITDSRNFYMTFASSDVYKNENGILIEEYYIIPNFSESGYYKSFQILNIKENQNNEVYFSKPLSANIYIHGVVDGILYFFDKNNLTQYSLNPKTLEYNIIGSEDKNGQAYIDGNWEEINVYELNKSKVLFSEDFSKINMDYVKAFKSGKFYYFYDKNNVFYKAYVDNPSLSIALFKAENIDEVRVVDDTIYFIQDNTIYRYKGKGIVPLIERVEFKYNKLNIYDVHLKG